MDRTMLTWLSWLPASGPTMTLQMMKTAMLMMFTWNSVTATLMVAVEVVMTDVIVSGVVLARHAAWRPHMSFCDNLC